MESYSLENVDFTYPEGEKKALNGITFRVQQGEFLVLCGPSGCGKSTLLRHLKTCLMPQGLRTGEIRYQGQELSQMTQREQAQQIGFVLQSPENQVVTDKVWHELAFGLESLGYDTPTIRRRVAEIAAFFGIENWFEKGIHTIIDAEKDNEEFKNKQDRKASDFDILKEDSSSEEFENIMWEKMNDEN